MNKEEFFSLVLDNKKIIYKVCSLYCSNTSDRDDLAQDILIHLWNASESYDPQYKVSTWMYRISLNVAISFFRKESRRVQNASILEDNIVSSTELGAESDDLDNDIKQLYRLISELGELNRALMLLYLDGHSYKEISGILGISETNVASKVSRIKKKLKQKFLKLQSR